jgi:2'-5' RNA ligase
MDTRATNTAQASRVAGTADHVMAEQLGLPGLDARGALFEPKVIDIQGGSLLGYTLLLAIFPLPAHAQRIAAAAADLRCHHGLNGTLLRPERLHITLLVIAGVSVAMPRAVVDAVVAAASAVSVACPPLNIVFDYVLSFPASQAFVLRCSADSDAAVARLRRPLAAALRRFGLRPEASGTPHMTMLYDSRRVAAHAVEPIRWTATRFALVLSHVGAGHHEWIAQWGLTGSMGDGAAVRQAWASEGAREHAVAPR